MNQVVAEYHGRTLSLVDLEITLVDRPFQNEMPKRIATLQDYPQGSWSDGCLKLSNHPYAPDLELTFRTERHGFVRIDFKLSKTDETLFLDGLRLRFQYVGQGEFKNTQSYFSSHSFAFNGVLKEKKWRVSQKPSRFEDLLFRERRGIAWWLTSLKAVNSPASLFLGSIFPRLFKISFSICKNKEGHEVNAFYGLQGDYLPLMNGIEGDSIGICISDSILKTFENYAEITAERSKVKLDKPQSIGWSSWYKYYPRIQEKVLEQELIQIGQKLLPSGFQLFQIDDGYQIKVGDWQANLERFPCDLKSMVEKINAKGMRAGVWFAPFMVDVTSKLASKAPPYWFLHDFSGDKIIYKIPKHSTNFILDITNPEVKAWLKGLVVQFKSSGFQYFKIDFLLLSAVTAKRFDFTKSPLEAYKEGVQTIREVAGPDVTILHSGSVDLLGLGFGDSNRTGPDIAYDVFGGKTRLALIRGQMNATASHSFMIHKWFTPNADAVLIRPPLSDSLVEVMLAQVAMTSGDYVLSDDLQSLSEDRLKKLTHPLLLQLAKSKGRLLPLDYFENVSPFQIPPNPLMLSWMQNPPRIWLWQNPLSGQKVLFLYNLTTKPLQLKRDLNALSQEVYGAPLFEDGSWTDIFNNENLRISKGSIDFSIPKLSVRIYDLV